MSTICQRNQKGARIMTSGQLKYEKFMVDLTREYRPQREWAEGRGLYLIIGHFLVGVAGGAWIFGHLFDHPASLVCSFFLAVGGGLCHLINLGRPERFWRMMRCIRTSWVARGFWGISFFMVATSSLIPLSNTVWLPSGIPALASRSQASFTSGVSSSGCVK